MDFQLKAPFQPTGDQPEAIRQLIDGIHKNYKHQVLLGATATGKTYTIANIIAQVNKPALVMAHNKTLAAQLYAEFRDFFPDNAVEYFVSYYDYYQPEAYVPRHDLYIEKETDINEEIERLRLAATTALMSRKDVIIVASVSCIYGLGSPEAYGRVVINLETGACTAATPCCASWWKANTNATIWSCARGLSGCAAIRWRSSRLTRTASDTGSLFSVTRWSASLSSTR